MEGQQQTAAAGWYNDPLRRFEYRYFNGVQWTSDVSINGHRYVDSPNGQGGPQQQHDRRGSRGFAVASFVTGLCGLVFGWIPFVFVVATAAALAAIVFGIVGLNAATRQDGHGRGFAVAGLTLAPFALAACVGGFFFTRAVVREVRAFVDPGPHELVVDQPCTYTGGRATLNGTIHNLDDGNHDYRIVVDFEGAGDSTSATGAVSDVAPGATAPWSVSADVASGPVTCKVTDVFGPLPFDIDPDG